MMLRSAGEALMSHDVRNSLTALLAVLMFFSASYLVVEFLGAERVSWTALALTLLNLLAIITLRISSRRA
jgi:hypothetical protein